MHRYNFENKIHFVIDENPDNISSFEKAEYFLKQKMKVIPAFNSPAFWFSGLMDFQLHGIELSLIYHDMGGTELIIKDSTISEDNLKLIQSVAEEIYQTIHNNETP